MPILIPNYQKNDRIDLFIDRIDRQNDHNYK
jgi:hypothetical protein